MKGISLGYMIIILTVNGFVEGKLQVFAKISPNFRQKGHLTNIYEDRLFTTNQTVTMASGLANKDVNAGPFAELMTHYLYYNFYHKANKNYSKKALGLAIEESVKYYNSLFKKLEYNPDDYRASAGLVASFLRREANKNFLDIAVMGTAKAILLKFKVSAKTKKAFFDIKFNTPTKELQHGIPVNVNSRSNFGTIMPSLDLTRHEFKRNSMVIMTTPGLADNIPNQIIVLLTNIINYVVSKTSVKVHMLVVQKIVEVFKTDYIAFLKNETSIYAKGKELNFLTYKTELQKDPNMVRFKKYIFFNPQPEINKKKILKSIDKLIKVFKKKKEKPEMQNLFSLLGCEIIDYFELQEAELFSPCIMMLNEVFATSQNIEVQSIYELVGLSLIDLGNTIRDLNEEELMTPHSLRRLKDTEIIIPAPTKRDVSVAVGIFIPDSLQDKRAKYSKDDKIFKKKIFTELKAFKPANYQMI